MIRRALAALVVAVLWVPATASARDGEGLEALRELTGREVGDGSGGAWTHGLFGYVRTGYERVQDDPNFAFIGRNDGFLLESARLGYEGIHEVGLRFRVSIEAANDLDNPTNTPLSELDVRARDAFVRYDPGQRYVGLQVGQFKVPFAEEELRSTADLLFASRAVGFTGVPVGRGLEEAGLEADRQIGVMISSPEPTYIGDVFGFAFYGMISNGNGRNQTLNDNGDYAYTGRLELYLSDIVMAGAAVQRNDRTVGTPPDLFDERDVSIAADLLVEWQGAELFGQYVSRRTTFPTTGEARREQLAWHVQGGYELPVDVVSITPAYRCASFDPWAGDDTGERALDDRAIRWHTFGVRVRHPLEVVGLSAYLNYTIAQEEASRAVDNDRFEALVQVVF